MPPRSISGVTPPMSGRGEGGDPGDRAAFYAGSMGTISGSLGSRNPEPWEVVFHGECLRSRSLRRSLGAPGCQDADDAAGSWESLHTPYSKHLDIAQDILQTTVLTTPLNEFHIHLKLILQPLPTPPLQKHRFAAGRDWKGDRPGGFTEKHHLAVV